MENTRQTDRLTHKLEVRKTEIERGRKRQRERDRKRENEIDTERSREDRVSEGKIYIYIERY